MIKFPNSATALPETVRPVDFNPLPQQVNANLPMESLKAVLAIVPHSQ